MNLVLCSQFTCEYGICTLQTDKGITYHVGHNINLYSHYKYYQGRYVAIVYYCVRVGSGGGGEYMYIHVPAAYDSYVHE